MGHGRGNGVPGSPHDFSTEPWNYRREVCVPCHVPHDQNASPSLQGVGILWNHRLSERRYTMYAEATFTSFVDGAADAEPTGTTKMCLGCHDGSVGIDQFGARTEGAGHIFIQFDYAGAQIPGPTLMGYLTNTHPVGVVYSPGPTSDLRDPGEPMGASGSIGDVLDRGSRVACMSCHDVHDASGESVPGTKLLRVANIGRAGGRPSGLCVSCHRK